VDLFERSTYFVLGYLRKLLNPGVLNTAPVSHQKQPHQNATNAIEIEQKRRKINDVILPLITVWLQVRVRWLTGEICRPSKGGWMTAPDAC
jgi:hypothetical protein